MGRYRIQRTVQAPVDVAWAVISDVEGYAGYAPNLTGAVIESGAGEGMRRRCWDTQGKTWTERCVYWEAGRGYSMEVDISSYPYPFEQMRGTWRVEEAPGGARITMQFDYKPKNHPLAWLLALFMRAQAGRIARPLMDNWQAAIEQRVVTG